MVALFSADAGDLAMIKLVQETIVLRTVLLEMGIEARIFAHTDSSAAKASVE